MTDDKQALIRQMLDMQKKFISMEHEGVTMKDFFAPDGDHPLAGYSSEYASIANQVVDLAHEEKQSKR